MKSSLSRFARTALMAAVAIVSCVAAATLRAARWLFAMDGPPAVVANAYADPQRLPEPQADLTRAGAFAQRMLKRQRPQIEDSWRLCPSV